ncbi:tRNA-splicing endonuclease subunit SEN2 [Phyllosticta citriasiana]|uniref:tRNA-splicing endonuclease subunit SEN2 n=1 Tax=Phyllosticta citriasiana TaxID=595635 RepID=UPI0030FDF247
MGDATTALAEEKAPNDGFSTRDTQAEGNGHVAGNPNGQDSQHTSSKPASKPAAPRRPKRPNYAQIHERPLPIVTYPLPAFVPHNPLSLLRVAYLMVSQYFFPPPSHPPKRHVAYLSRDTRSVHVTDWKSVRALWEQGFFGKGSLSRSEPTWLDREKNRRGTSGQLLAEDYTQKRRQERRDFKNERARKEREAIEEQLRKEGKLVDEPAVLASSNTHVAGAASMNGYDPQPEAASATVSDNAPTLERSNAQDALIQSVPEDSLQNEEHLQLALEEAFFLTYGLGVLDIVDLKTNESIDTQDFFRLCRSLSYFPPADTADLRPDDSFLLKYVVYHHFRSRGWVVRDGVKFSVDFMIYNRGPAFSHAEFAVQIIPSYSHSYWDDKKKPEPNPWWWLYCASRVQSNVLKTLVMVYVEVPPPLEDDAGNERDIGALLKRFKVREFVLKRWVANRMRN